MLGHSTKTTANGKPAFCICVRGDDSPYQQVTNLYSLIKNCDGTVHIYQLSSARCHGLESAIDTTSIDSRLLLHKMILTCEERAAVVQWTWNTHCSKHFLFGHRHKHSFFKGVRARVWHWGLSGHAQRIHWVTDARWDLEQSVMSTDLPLLELNDATRCSVEGSSLLGSLSPKWEKDDCG